MKTWLFPANSFFPDGRGVIQCAKCKQQHETESPGTGLEQNPLQSFPAPLKNPGQTHKDALTVQMHAKGLGLNSTTWFSSLSGGSLPILVSGAALQTPTGGKLVQDSDICSFKVNSLHRKKLKKKSIPLPTKSNHGTLEKGLIPEPGLRNTKINPHITVPREQRQAHRVRRTSWKNIEATPKELQPAKLRPFEH